MFRILSRFSKYISGLAIGFGGIVLTGWAFHIQRLKGIMPGQVAVKANAALCFVLIGLALWLAASGIRKRSTSVASTSLALLASFIGLLSFLEYWNGWDFGIDQLLFTAGPDDLPGSVRLALMSPIAAADFFLLGIAIAVFAIKGRWGRVLENVLPGIAAVAATFGILDFVLDPQRTHTHIAPITALILFLFSFAVLVARAESGLGALFLSKTVGGMLCRRLLPSAILIPIAIAWLRWKGEHTGLYSDWTGLAIMTVTSGVLLAGLTVWTALVLDRSDVDRSKAEESARSLATIVTCSNDAIIGKTLDGIVTSWNPGAEAIYGYSAEEMIGRSVSRIIPPDRFDEFQRFLQQLRSGKTIRHYETERIRKDGDKISVSVSISPVKDAKGAIVGASTITRDITERKNAEDQVLRVSRYSRSLIEASLDPLVTISKQGKITDVNKATEKATGISRERLIGSDFCDYFTEPEKARAGYARVFEEGLVRDYPLALRDSSGAVRDVLYNATVFKEPNGEVEGVFAAARDVTERKRAEDELRRISRYSRSLIEASLDPLVTISRAGKITDVNQATETATGVSRDRLIGSDFSDYFTEPEKAREGYSRVFEQGLVRDYPLAIRNTSGSVMDVLYNATVIRGANGEVEGVFAAARDITERRKAEQEAQAGRDRLALAMTVAKAGSFDWNIITNVDVWSREKELLYGLRPGQFSGTHQDWEAFVFPEDRPRVQALVDLAFQTGDFVAEFRIRRRDNGEIRWMNVRAKVVFGNDGKPLRMVGINLDVTERKQAEEKVLEASRYTRNLIEASLDPLVTISADGKITDVNEATEKATGMTRDHLIGSDFSGYFTEPEKARQGYRQVFSSGLVRDYPLLLRHSSGSTMEVLYNATVFRNARGEAEGVFAAARDVTDLKRTEQELRLSRERLALALKAGHAGTFDWDMQSNVNLWTPEVERVHGLQLGEFGGKYQDWEALVLAEDLPQARACIENSIKTGELVGEWRIRRRNDGEIRWITARAKILSDDKGKPWRMIGVNIDVTERKQAEEEVRKLNDELEQRVIQRTAELEAANKELEAFTYSVSHDLRAPLRHISGFSKMLSEEFSESLPPDAQHHVQRIQEGTRRMGQLVDDLLNLGRVGRKDLSLQVAGLRSIIDDVIENLKSDIGDRQVEWKIGDLPYVECDTALIQQVFQNLLSNALKFTRPRAKTVIEIGHEQRDGQAVVYVRDNGVGFSMKYADKLFGVFQRLHRAEDFEGTGVGLATVQRIIQKHGGRIWAEAELDKGANFYFTLGASQSAEANSKAVAAGEKL